MISGDSLTVYDKVTGLTWTQSPDLNGDGDIDSNDKLTHAGALTYADTTLNPPELRRNRQRRPRDRRSRLWRFRHEWTGCARERL